MRSKSRRGFTLIELLVVIAIIGILAAMLFPVFARARESARKTQCLANVKNIALAINMYVSDYDAVPPAEHRPEVSAFFDGDPGRARGSAGGADCGKLGTDAWGTRANPYLRWPVVLDEYIKNRDVWRCPSAKLQSGASFVIGLPDWVAELRGREGAWGGGWSGVGPCYYSWPSGWGGAVTDSIVQQTLATTQTGLGSAASSEANNTFVQSIGCNTPYGLKMAAVQNASSFPIVGDTGMISEHVSLGILAYPEICCMECTGLWGWPPPPDKACVSSCGDCYNYHANMRYHTDPEYRKTAARHMGGVNIGYLDGHAKWTASESFLAEMRDGHLEGISNYCPQHSTREGYAATCGDPNAPGLYFLY